MPAFILILIPVFFQLIVGSLSIARKIKWKFGYIGLTSLGSQLICIYAAVKLVSYEVSKDGPKCGLPMTAMLFTGIFMLIILLVIIIIQLVYRSIIRRKSKLKA